MPSGRRSLRTGDTSPTCSAMATTPASGYARQRARTTCGLSHPSEVWRSSAPRLRPMAHLSTSFVRRMERRGRSGAYRFLAARPDCWSPMWRAPSRGRQTVSASRSCALESLPRFRRNCSWQTPMADRNASWPAKETSAPWISLVAPWRPSFPPAWSPDGRLIALAAAGQRKEDGSCSWTAALGRYRTLKVAQRGDGRTQLARCPVARAQLSSPARRPEPVDSAAVSRRSAVEAHQRSE